MTQNEFINQIRKDFPQVNDNFFDKVEIYKIFLQQYNKKVNLTRLDSEQKIYGEYFYESTFPYINIDFNRYKKILDIGSGSGIPGVLLKLLFPNIELFIIEANAKKVAFLHELINHLHIHAHIEHKRAEMIKSNEYETFDLVTSRAVAPLKVIIEISLPYVKVQGLLIEPKGTNVNKELNGVDTLISKLGGDELVIQKLISFNKCTHNIITIKKIAITNHIFPRKWSIISKGIKND